jgi:hypothetical protein
MATPEQIKKARASQKRYTESKRRQKEYNQLMSDWFDAIKERQTMGQCDWTTVNGPYNAFLKCLK